MITTCGVLITNGASLLIAHPTGNRHWDIPKGRQDPGETLAKTASRELREETGLMVSADRLRYLGIFAYKSDKCLALFRLDVTEMPDPKTLHCASEFERDGAMIKEMDDWCVVGINRALDMVYPALRPILHKVLNHEA
jgi:putative (di)nucleoside polyphosphate hydrolase